MDESSFLNERTLLNAFLSSDTIDEALIWNELKAMKNRKELEQKYKVTAHPFRDRYRVRVKDREGNYHSIYGRTEDEAKRKAIDFYQGQVNSPSVLEVYNEWIEAKVRREEIKPQTKDSYDGIVKQCLSSIEKKEIQKLTAVDIEEYVKDTIHDCRLTSKRYALLKIVLRGVFGEARRKGLISYRIDDVLKDMQLSNKVFRHEIKEEHELFYSDEELQNYDQYLLSHADVLNLAIWLFVRLGLRPGEMMGLKWTDLDIEKQHIFVRRMDTRHFDETGHLVSKIEESTKTEAGRRKVVFPSECKIVFAQLRQLNSEDEYIFSENGIRYTYLQIKKRHENNLKNHLKFEKKSLNKFRKTYASILVEHNIPESVIISQMGHTDIKTTRSFYIKDRANNDAKIKMLDGIFG